MSKFRDYNAIDACFRSGGPMKDRRAPRGGAKNKRPEYLDEYWEDYAMRVGLKADFCFAESDGQYCTCGETPRAYAESEKLYSKFD